MSERATERERLTDEELASRLDQLAMQVTEIWEDTEKHAVLRQAARRLRSPGDRGGDGPAPGYGMTARDYYGHLADRGGCVAALDSAINEIERLRRDRLRASADAPTEERSVIREAFEAGYERGATPIAGRCRLCGRICDRSVDHEDGCAIGVLHSALPELHPAPIDAAPDRGGEREWLHAGDVKDAVAALLFKGDPSMGEEVEKKEWEWAYKEADRLLYPVRRRSEPAREGEDHMNHPYDRVSTEHLIELMEECADNLTAVSDGGQIIIGRGEDREYTSLTCGGIAIALREAAHRLRSPGDRESDYDDAVDALNELRKYASATADDRTVQEWVDRVLACLPIPRAGMETIRNPCENHKTVDVTVCPICLFRERDALRQRVARLEQRLRDIYLGASDTENVKWLVRNILEETEGGCR